MDDDISTSMVNSGSSMCRANLSEDHGPEAIFPSIMGNHSMTHHIIKRVYVAPEEHPMLLTESLLNPEANQEKTQIILKTSSTTATYMAI
ncbi:hypothetical protein J1605_013371 [Eschrichtius robustus]|uniref:Uncharacterized protein n=1 Tax=Eschrichtius robustus TaxID=9764 RepID=A0AB34GGB9_ESCRO|nr:hypothetical protein J1605_013371 [Eschrichtius robustus]